MEEYMKIIGKGKNIEIKEKNIVRIEYQVIKNDE